MSDLVGNNDDGFSDDVIQIIHSRLAVKYYMIIPQTIIV